MLKNWQKILLGSLALIAVGVIIGRATKTIKTITVADSSAIPSFTLEIDTNRNKKDREALWKEAKKYWDNKPRPVRTIIVHDTIEGESLPPDTVYVPQKTNYVATTKKDTIINDGLLKLKLSFISPIPLHPDSYFRYNIASKYTEPVIPRSWYKDRIIIYLGFGLSSNGYSLPKPSFQFGLGINLKSIF